MSLYVVDASVAAKWYLPEADMDAANRLLVTATELSAPSLIWPEFGNVLSKRRREGLLRLMDAKAIAAEFARVPIRLCPSAILLDQALELAALLEQTTYDCLYLALAILSDRPLVTADIRFCGAVEKSQFAGHAVRIGDFG